MGKLSIVEVLVTIHILIISNAIVALAFRCFLDVSFIDSELILHNKVRFVTALNGLQILITVVAAPIVVNILITDINLIGIVTLNRVLFRICKRVSKPRAECKHASNRPR
jgi:hypothetical protein